MLTLLNLLSAVALLVWGTHIVRTGIMRVYGANLRRVLSRSVRHTPLAFAAGIGVTALVQSSNATALLATSFVGQGLMTLRPALAIMLGADVGTALMARVLTFDLSWLSPLLILPDRPQTDITMNPRHLDTSVLDTPALALANAAREALRMGDVVEHMLTELMALISGGTKAQGREVRRLDDDVDALYTAIKLYLARIPREDLGDRDSRRWAQIIELAINLEQAGDIIERMASDLENKKISANRSFSEQGLEELAALHGHLMANLRLCLSVFLSGDVDSARRLRRAKQRFRVLERRYAHAHVERLHHQVVQSIETSSLHLGLLSDMKRLNSLFCSIAYGVLEQAESGYETEHAASMETPPDLHES